MANGPAADLLREAVLTLLQGRNPSPIAPVPIAPADQIGPLDFETTAALAALQPQPVPPALPGPVDADAIRSRFAGMAGPEPVAPPPPEPTSLIIRIARALQGYGAGFQGQGVQFLESLQAQKEAPQKEFRARKERFDTRKQELGVMAEQAILTAEDRRMARTMELIDKQADRDYQKAATASGIKKAEALERLRGAIDMERDARKAEAERLEQERKDAKERKVQIANLANTLTDDFKISRQQARRFAEHELNGTPLSQADAKQYARIEKYRRPAGGAGAGQPKVMVEIVNEDGSKSVVPYGSVSAGINAGTITPGPRGVFMEGQAQPPASSASGASPEGIPLALGTPGGPQPYATAQAGKIFTRAEVEAHAKRKKRDPKAVEADIRAAGGIVVQ